MISIIGALSEFVTPAHTKMVIQELSQASMWLLCAVVGWACSSLILKGLGYKKGMPNKAQAGSDAFRKEVVAYASQYSSPVAAQHFGVSESEVQDYEHEVQEFIQDYEQKYTSGFKNSSVNGTAETAIESELEAPSDDEALFTSAPSVHVGHALLEHYDVFGTCVGTWSGALGEQKNAVSTPEPPQIPVSAFNEIKAEEFFEGDESMSLWLVPDGFVYDVQGQNWVDDSA